MITSNFNFFYFRVCEYINFEQKVKIFLRKQKTDSNRISILLLSSESITQSGLARIELATRSFGDSRSTTELQPYKMNIP